MSQAAPTRPATTVVLMRPDGDGFRIFMVQRNRAVGFMPNAWVFPGGRVDAADRLADGAVRGGERAIAAFGLDRGEAVAHLVAGVRETLEESGLWLGEGAVSAELRASLNRGEIDLPGILARTGATLDLDRFAPWAWWLTPDVEPKRFNTRFLVALASEGEAVHDAGETVASAWLSASEAMAKADRGELPMAPPTWWTLKELSAFRTVDEVFAEAWKRPQRPIQPIASFASGEFELLLPGHPDHPQPAFPGLPTKVKFVQGRWWAAQG